MTGTEGNERLTGVTAVILVALLAVEGVTIITLSPLLPVHLFVGLALIPPVGLKLASAGWRFARYYTREPRYRRRGPPPMLLRATAPVLVVTTIVVLASGVWLLLAGPSSRDSLLPIHKISFIVWLAFAGLHVVGHVLELPPTLSAEYGHGSRAPGWVFRQSALAFALVAGVALALLMEPHYAAWQNWFGH